MRSVEGEFTGTTVAASDRSNRAFLTYVGANRNAREVIAECTAECTLEARHLHWAAPADAELLARFRARGMSISLDVGFPHADARCLAALPVADLFFPNEVEAERLTGEREPEAMLRSLARAGARTVVLKLGPRGAVMLADGRLLWADPPACNSGGYHRRRRLLQRRLSPRLASWRTARSVPEARGTSAALSPRDRWAVSPGSPTAEEIAWHME